MSDVPLPVFFDRFIPYVMGQLSSAELEASIGSSPSGRRQLEVYAGVVRANLRIALDAMYPSVKRAADATAPELWSRVLDDFLTAHPPRHADPNRCGEPLTAFLVDRRARNGEQPAHLEELADYEWIRFCAVTSKTTGRDRTIFVRRYTHAVPSYAEATERCSPAASPREVPAATPVMIIVFRSTKTLRTQVVSPSTAQLFALARNQGELDPQQESDLLSRSALSERDLAQAEAQLYEMGLLDEEHRR